MARRDDGPLTRLLNRGTLARWARAARRAPRAELSALHRQRQVAGRLVHHLGEVIAVADSRLALPRIGSAAFARPPGTDWSWRPAIWRSPLPVRGAVGIEGRMPLGDEVALHHDCPLRELTLRQVRNQRETDLAPFGLRLDVFRFDGSYLSLVVELPETAAEGLRKRHLIRLDTLVETERPLEIFARLNVKHGPNVEQIVRELPRGQDQVHVEFDLAYTRLDERRAERMWLDLIFEGPEMNQVTLRDLTFARLPRADI
ncbi:DUF6478 family protein [Wenxinia saemankumensis]|uniref:Uncharacterized protein n=1 Tax=Wenxinia saemankumensis TaxID=1447782 RepID=A0A1M6CAQ4_9RHOB|nr:DUF6478 family protein [Wenxinia saemankumensis]SHI58076.1 hypothetical protein SAMN05444417_1098 [Wenxinia saemankumensis]